MKIYNNAGRHIKNVPSRYIGIIADIEGLISDLEHKRLSPIERRDMELELFKQGLSPQERDAIKGKPCKRANEVRLKNGEPYYSITFGKIEVKCPIGLYKLVNPKKTIFRV